MIPVNQAGAPIGEIPFSRTGLLGFVGPVRHKKLIEQKCVHTFVLLSESAYFSGQSGVCSWENWGAANGERAATQRWRPRCHCSGCWARKDSLQGEVRHPLTFSSLALRCLIQWCPYQYSLLTSLNPSAARRVSSFLCCSSVQDRRLLSDGVLWREDSDCGRTEARCQWGRQFPVDE